MLRLILLLLLLGLGLALAQSEPPSPAAISTCIVDEWVSAGAQRWTCYPVGGLVELLSLSPALPSLAVLLAYSVGLALGRSI